ncbi:hypothetical protein SPRG_05914 [Saprolegnia parasitica CBS 223.65]|uniref:Uncharacterized protein n=1 Tax=Saprolegnia parasitica (strain CBS 223.65) TaxID=695850 RepID=A0A067CFV1_SAPPC|nr:hypothetical protein SPRG_05914 [Saprolegnia parasitica CBS 223.65]KDO29378.1 hypothetical protein SPRG_05914 [Saprolegnia parasitica CBS 223.65]|eukprot:XP_012199881.1 hypothetical protein SPRG_05914 [Saprolegnia parasitica CBS 223.65]
MWDFDANVTVLATTFSLGLAFFLVGFACAYRATRRKHATENVNQVPDVTLIKYCTKVLRVLCLGVLGCQFALFAHATSVPSTALNVPLFDSLHRPLLGALCTAFGFSTNFHPSVRHLFLVAMLSLVTCDTISEVHYLSIAECAAKGQLCSPIPVTSEKLLRLVLRDLVSIVLELWAALQVAYLCLAIGCCSSRYSARQLSISNPYSNVRDLLVKYHPELKLKPMRLHELNRRQDDVAVCVRATHLEHEKSLAKRQAGREAPEVKQTMAPP